MKAAWLSFLCAVVVVFSRVPFASADTLHISHYQAHERYLYGAHLLDLAFSKLDIPYQITVPEYIISNEARGEREVIAGNLDLQWMSTSTDRESEMIAIKIPIYQGMLGLRLLLVERARHQELSKISSIDELRHYTGGHGLHWGDLPVYAANKLSVVTHKHYDSIFKLLKLGRIDYFHRGINEIWDEHQRHHTELSIADNVMLYYPLPVYYFVSKLRPEIAALLKKGLELAIEDGSFKALFLSYMGQFLQRGKLDQRNLIVLNNPKLPPDTPDIGVDWWLPEQHLSLIE